MFARFRSCPMTASLSCHYFASASSTLDFDSLWRRAAQAPEHPDRFPANVSTSQVESLAAPQPAPPAAEKTVGLALSPSVPALAALPGKRALMTSYFGVNWTRIST